MNDDERPVTLIDTATAAVAAGVSPAVIRNWVRLGKLEPALRRRGRSGNLYSLEDVFRAKSTSRDEPVWTLPKD